MRLSSSEFSLGRLCRNGRLAEALGAERGGVLRGHEAGGFESRSQTRLGSAEGRMLEADFFGGLWKVFETKAQKSHPAGKCRGPDARSRFLRRSVEGVRNEAWKGRTGLTSRDARSGFLRRAVEGIQALKASRLDAPRTECWKRFSLEDCGRYSWPPARLGSSRVATRKDCPAPVRRAECWTRFSSEGC